MVPDRALGKILAQILEQASWVRKLPPYDLTCLPPSEWKRQLAGKPAPVAPPSNFGGKFFG